MTNASKRDLLPFPLLSLLLKGTYCSLGLCFLWSLLKPVYKKVQRSYCRLQSYFQSQVSLAKQPPRTTTSRSHRCLLLLCFEFPAAFSAIERHLFSSLSCTTTSPSEAAPSTFTLNLLRHGHNPRVHIPQSRFKVTPNTSKTSIKTVALI